MEVLKMKQNTIKLPKFPKSGVYAIINITKRKCYIGQADNIQNRASTHISQLKHNKHSIKEMQEDFNNGDKFVFEIIKETPKYKIFVQKYQRRCIEAYYIQCMLELKIKIYNKSYKNADKDFFWYAVRLDKDVEKLRNKILF